jgi:hypothetical protein
MSHMRRPQFSLKTIFVATALAAAACLGLTLERWRRVEQREAQETEEALQRVRGEPGSTTLPRIVDE